MAASEPRSRRGSRAVLGLSILVLALAAVGGYVWLGRTTPQPSAEDTAPAAPVGERGARLAGGDSDPATGGAISGRVLGPEGTGVADAPVAVQRQRGRDETPGAPVGPTGPSTPRVVRAGADGSFRVEGLAPGRYSVAASGPGLLGAVRGGIEVAPRGHVTGVELRLAPGGHLLSGRVLDAGGGSIAGAQLLAQRWTPPLGNEVPEMHVFAAQSDGEGRYRVHLAKGRYTLRVTSDGYASGNDFLDLSADEVKDFRLEPAARISGRVVRSEGGQPVAGAEVRATPTERSAAMMFNNQSVTADDSGAFTLGNLVAGSYRVSARKGGLVGQTPQVVGVASGAGADSVEIAVSTGGVVSGTVKSSDGKPVAGARVSLLARNFFGGSGENSARSDAKGAYRIEGVLPGDFRLHATADGYGSEGGEIAVSGPITRDFVLPEGIVVSGIVLDAAGRPAAGAEVEASSRPSGGGMFTSDRGTTDAEGRFTFKRLGPGEITLTAKRGDEVARFGPEPLAPATKKELTVKLERGARVSGQVVWDDGAPAAGIRINGSTREMGGARVEGRSGPDGTFTMGPFPPGESSIAAQAPGDRITWSSRERPEQANFTLAAGEQKTGLKLTVTRKRGSIRGVVVGPDGQPLAGASVQAARERERGRAFKGDLDGGGRAVTGPDGAFAIEELASGSFTLWAAHPGHPEREQTGVAAGASSVRLQLHRSASIAGVVVDGSGRPIRPYSLVVVPPGRAGESEGMRLRMAMDMNSRPLSVDDARGAFRAQDLAPGAYDLVATTPDGRTARASGIAVAEGEAKQGVRLTVQEALTVTGRVLEYEGGQPLAGARVAIREPGSSAREARTDATGAFTLEKVPALPSLGISVDTEPRTHISEYRPVPAGREGRADLGTIRLLKYDPKRPNKGRVGITYGEQEGKVVINAVLADSPGARAGLRKGDTVLEVDGKKLSGADFGTLMGAMRDDPGKELTVVVQSPGGPPRTVKLRRDL
jgi:hypothetical protein